MVHVCVLRKRYNSTREKNLLRLATYAGFDIMNLRSLRKNLHIVTWESKMVSISGLMFQVSKEHVSDICFSFHVCCV